MIYRILSGAAAMAMVLAAAPGAMAQQDWTGFYAGLNAGASWGDTSLDVDVGTAAGTINLPAADIGRINQVGADDGNKTAFTGGIQGGYNYQSGPWVFGLESDFGFFDLDQHRTNVYQSVALINPPISYALDQRIKTQWIWTVRPRIGYASDLWMIYATAGMAMSQVKLETTFADNRIPQNFAELHRKDTDTGWTGGLGGAYAFSPNMSFRGEWLYADFGKVHETVTGPNGFVTLTPEAKVRANIFRMGVDYKF